MLNKNKSQVWIETAVYTLIGLTIIAILLAIITPQIQKAKDKSVLEQTISALESINSKILETEQAPGNVRIIDLKLVEGKLDINSQQNSLVYTLENTKLEFSQPGEEIVEGNLKIKTEKEGSRFKTTLTINYNEIEITYDNQEISKTLQKSPQPHRIKIENIGDQATNSPVHIDFSVI